MTSSLGLRLADSKLNFHNVSCRVLNEPRSVTSEVQANQTHVIDSKNMSHSMIVVLRKLIENFIH